MPHPLQHLSYFFTRIKHIGISPAMDDYEKRRLGIFNLLNFFGCITGLVIPLAGFFNKGYLPPLAWMVAFSPFVISGVVLVSNYYRHFQFSFLWYFFTYPVITALVYAGNIDVGIELLFIFYGVLSVFFLQKSSRILLVIAVSVICYFSVFVVHKEYKYVLSGINFPFYFFIHFVCVAFIFLVLFLIKKENTGYQLQMKSTNIALLHRNEEILKQRKLLAEKAAILEAQTAELTELNTVKSRLFSIISHDLRTPVYGLRNLFKNIQQYDLPGEEIKLLLPEIVNDLEYTTNLMDNLLQWAKSQLQGSNINAQIIDVAKLVEDVKKLLRLQAENKKIYLEAKVNMPVSIYADKDMIDLVLRNLLSNAIKFTPENGHVCIEANTKEDMVEISVRDTGIGISAESMLQLFGNKYFTTKGTSNEIGTGLGLNLCKEFLTRNGGAIKVQSEPGKGSIFSFTLPKA